MADPLHDDILLALRGPLDDQMFEECAAAQLGRLYPGLVHVPGGSDFGVDAISDAGPDQMLMTATVSPRVVDNMRRSLRRHVVTDGAARKVLVATSQPIGAAMRRKLEQAAEQEGFRLIQTFDRDWFADVLYHDDHWRRRLLHLSGAVPAVSTIPPSRRGIVDISLIGRTGEMSELRASTGDIVLRGQPGSGKTFLLRALVNEGWGAFLVSTDMTAVANDIRRLSPDRIIIDDAHFAPGLVTSLKQLRRQLDESFAIVATCWPNWPQDPASELDAHTEVPLGLLTRGEIVEALVEQGVRNPDAQALILEQARGRIGLATTLAQLALAGFVEDLASGRLILRDLRGAFFGNLPHQSRAALAVLALSGERGLRDEELASAVALSSLELSAALREFASGGLIDSAGNGRLVVVPERLRFGLILDEFFGTVPVLPLATVVASLPEPAAAAFPLIAAAQLGAPVDPGLLIPLVRNGDTRTLRAFAAVGPDEAAAALDFSTGSQEVEVADAALGEVPALAVDRLLHLAVGDDRQLHSATDHPLRRLGDWLQQPEDPIGRRRLVVGRATAGGIDPDVAYRAVALALSPGLQWHTVVPGDSLQIELHSSVVREEEIISFADLWHDSVSRLPKGVDSVGALLSVASDWLMPTRWTLGATVSAVWSRRARQVARHAVRELLDAFGDRPGVRQNLRSCVSQAGAKVAIPGDADFEAIYPPRESRDWRRGHKKWAQGATALASRWSELTTADLIDRFNAAHAEARFAAVHGWPDCSVAVLRELLDRRTDVPALIRRAARVGLRHDLSVVLFSRLLATHPQGWRTLVLRMLDEPRLWRAAVEASLETTDDERVLAAAVQRADERFVTLVTFPGVQVRALEMFLDHSDPRLTQAAVMGVWNVYRELLEHDLPLLERWSAALVAAETDSTFIPSALSAYPDLISPWVENWVDRQVRDRFHREPIPPSLLQSIGALHLEARASLVSRLPARLGSQANGLIRALVADDIALLRRLFDRPELRSYALAALRGEVNDAWVERARVALDSGVNPTQVVEAAVDGYGDVDAYWGSESERLDPVVRAFEDLASGVSTEHATLGKVGVQIFRRRLVHAQHLERLEQIYGV